MLSTLSAIVIGMLIFSSLTTAKVDRDQGEIKTIGFDTGLLNDLDEVYRWNFEEGAKRACGDSSYKVLEKTRNPSTLSGMDLPLERFYWVIKCG